MNHTCDLLQLSANIKRAAFYQNDLSKFSMSFLYWRKMHPLEPTMQAHDRLSVKHACTGLFQTCELQLEMTWFLEPLL